MPGSDATGRDGEVGGPWRPSVGPVTRLVRVLAVVVGALIAAGGVAYAAIRSDVGSRQASLTTATRSTKFPATATTGPPAPATSPPATVGPSPPRTRGTTTGEATTTLFPNLAALTTTLDTALAGTDTCLSVQAADGRVLYQDQPDVALIPASTQKLLVAEAALSTLGPNYRFTTTVVAPAAPVGGKVAALWLVGDGDPLLAAPDYMAAMATRARMAGYPWTPLATLAASVAAAGVTSVAGGIHGDDRYEDQLRFLPVWPAGYEQQEQIGLLSALSVNEGIQYTPTKSSLAEDPPGYAASELAGLLAADHVAAAPEADQAAPAGGVVVASVSSAPLSQIVETMLRASDDWIAELVVRAIDKAAGGPGTTAGGTAVVLRDAAGNKIPMNGVVMVDGSGLSRLDRATCPELLAALDLAERPAYLPVLDGLAVAAETGTLVDRFQGTPLAGALRAKTGSLDGVAGLVGMVTTGSTVRFALLDNDNASETALYARQDAVAAALGAFTQAG